MMQKKIYKNIQCSKLDGDFIIADERIACETTLKIMINGKHSATTMLLANMEEEYVAGYLYVKGEINCAKDILSIEINNDIANIKIKEEIKKRAISNHVSSKLIVSRRNVFNCVQDILKSPIFKETEAVHSAGIFLCGKQSVSIAEDLGRHNALDKVIGAGLLKNVDFSKTLAASTGRQPTEMILKCLRAGIPIIATKGVATSMAVELAEKTGITIVGLVRGGEMVVYSHPERIE